MPRIKTNIAHDTLRVGKFSIHGIFIESVSVKNLSSIMRNVFPIRVEFSKYPNEIYEFTAISPYFSRLEEGDTIPIYKPNLTVHYDDGGEIKKTFINWEKVE